MTPRPILAALAAVPAVLAFAACSADAEVGEKTPTTASTPSQKSEETPATAEVPDVTGLTLDLARSTLQGAGFKVQAEGDGDVVADQDPTGTAEAGSLVTLTLEAPPADKGSRENPGQPGLDVITFSENGEPVWEVTVAAATWDAWDAVRAENQFNDPPREGFQYVLLPVTATYRGADTGLAWIDIDIKFVTADGRTFEKAPVVTPGALSDVSELYAGGVAEGNLVFEVPSDAIADATWAVKYGYFSDPMFFAAT